MGTDFEGIFRAFAISLGAGLLGGAIAFFVTRRREDWDVWKRVLIMATTGAVLILTVIIYYAWQTPVAVPSIDGLSQAEAESLLISNRLVPQAMPQYAVGVEPGRVVPKTQSPASGLPVKRGTVVSFVVNTAPAQTQPVGTPGSGQMVSIFEPRARQQVRPSRGADGIYKFSVTGASSGVSDGGFQLLLWIRPVNPPSEMSGWYLQRPPANGINRVEPSGSWVGLAQIGNAQWTPHEGDVLDLAVSVADNGTAKELMNKAGVVVENQPVGVTSDTALNLVVTLK